MENGLSKFLFTKMGVPNFAKYLDLGSFRQKLISGNMANAATPGYEAQGMDFEREYQRLTGQTNHLSGTLTNQYHIPLGEHKAKPPRIEMEKIKDGDVNSVDIDTEVANLAQNELQFTIGAELLKRKFDSMRNAITSK